MARCASGTSQQWLAPWALMLTGTGLQLSPDILGVSGDWLMSPACKLALQLQTHMFPVLVH